MTVRGPSGATSSSTGVRCIVAANTCARSTAEPTIRVRRTSGRERYSTPGLAYSVEVPDSSYDVTRRCVAGRPLSDVPPRSHSRVGSSEGAG